MDNYNEIQAKKELENLFNELFINDFKETFVTNQQEYQKVFDRFKQDLKEIIKDDLVGQVGKTIEVIRASYETVINEIRAKDVELVSDLQKCNGLIKGYDSQINANILESKRILSETSNEISNVIKTNKTFLYIVMGISSVSLVLSILGFII